MDAFEKLRAERSQDGGIDLESVLAYLGRYWLLLGIAVGCGLVGGYAASYRTPPTYRASVLVMPVSERQSQSSLRALAGQFSDLAGMLGVDVDPGSYPTAAVIAMTRSRDFIEGFISDNNLLPIIFAKKWDPQESAWKLEEGEDPPTLEDGYDVFSQTVLAIAEDRRNNLVTVSVDWTDRSLAADWANGIVARVNEKTRELAIAEADRSLAYLAEAEESYGSLDLRRSIYTLIESQMNLRMVASTTRDYAFRIIDRAQPPNPRKYVKPRRLRMAAFGSVVGMISGFLCSLILQRRRS